MSYDLKIKNGDILFENGDVKKVVDTDKLIQDILKICLTDVGSNPINPWYGSYLSRSVIGNPEDSGLLVQLAKSQLSSALENLKKLQSLQVNAFQKVSPSEHISSILDVSVVRNAVDPRLYDIRISVLTKSLTPVTTGFTMSAL